MSPAVFKEVVIPLLGVKDTATLAISTPDDEFNHYTKLIELQIKGKKVFKVIRVGLSCSRCLRRSIICIHRRSKLPAWKDVTRQEMIEAMYGGSEADKRLMLRETHGVTVSADIYIFRMYMHAFKSLKPYIYKDKIQVVHVAIDPASGGTGSDWGITSTCFENSNYVVSERCRNLALRTRSPRLVDTATRRSLRLCTLTRLLCARVARRTACSAAAP